MDTNYWTLGVMKVKRGASAIDPYTIEELGMPAVQLTGSSEVDLIPHYGGSWESVTNLVDNCKLAKLCIDIESGAIVVSERTPPVLKDDT